MKMLFLKFTVVIASCFMAISVYAQETAVQDTIRNETITGQGADFSGDKAKDLSPILLDQSILPDKQPKIVALSKFDIDPDAKFRINHETVSITPYQYSFFNPWEGLIMQGVRGRFELTDFMTAKLNYFVSGAYFGHFQPTMYINNSLQLNLELKIHDRVQLVGLGGVSVREGLDPRLPTYLGGANYYGAGMNIKVSNKVGIGFGVTKNYYKNNWTQRSYFGPVFY